MRKLIGLFFIVIFWISVASAETFNFPARDGQAAGAGNELVIYSTTDIDAVRPLIEDFQMLQAKIRVKYFDLQSLELFDRVLRESDAGKKTADFAFSSAMDLQMKLANDGYAQSYKSPAAQDIPSWANWRNEAFGITFEPAVIVYNKKFFAGRKVPNTRTQLIELLEKQNAAFFGKVATYDIQRSGLGFLVLARDQEHYNATWKLVRTFGRSSVKLYTSTAAILDRVSDGKFALGYNVLGSYAATRAERDPNIGIIMPSDHTVVLSRIALIPRNARSTKNGRLFLDYVLSQRGQRVLAEKAGLNAIHPAVTGNRTAAKMRETAGSSLRPIKVGPGLLVYLDQFKRSKMLTNWENALTGR
ncbi:MAG: ABC transporter substrate-binding protein [Rhodospirillaceae bacterium]|jgi:iron(III) transport system substrate-binding protein|nr:ABC transporter substrate-binding protein [Rhodospirillaceae bacterium]MBT7954422.1 ABC transporter substrate-binding protein [Rhodospirillaceae bacterium]